MQSSTPPNPNQRQRSARRRQRATAAALTLGGAVALVGALAPRPASAAELAVERTADGGAKLEFRADKLFDQEARDAIESGVTATIAVTWEIDRARGLWLDETLERQTQARTLSYDNVTKRYRVDVDGGSEGHYETSSFGEAERRIGTLETTTHADLTGPGTKLARVRLSCDSRDGVLPLGLAKVLFFLPGWGFDTGWVTAAVP